MTETKPRGAGEACAFRTIIGGQALIEGILMRGPKKQAIVVRNQEGGLEIKEEDLNLYYVADNADDAFQFIKGVHDRQGIQSTVRKDI